MPAIFFMKRGKHPNRDISFGKERERNLWTNLTAGLIPSCYEASIVKEMNPDVQENKDSPQET